MFTILFSAVFLILGIVVGWISAEKFFAYIQQEPHQFENLFEDNPHPELFNKKGELDRGEYMVVNFELGYNPEEFSPDDVTED
jgi:hypothetical protein